MREWDYFYRTGLYLDEWAYSHPSQELVTLAAVGFFEGMSSALDVGCGDGTEALFLSSLGLETVGVDISPEALRIANEKVKKSGRSVKLVRASAENLPFEDESFDFINDRSVMHHFDQTQKRRYAEEAVRVLKSGGAMLIRGSRLEQGGQFHPITEDIILRAFSGLPVSVGKVFPFEIVTNSGPSAANIVLIRKLS